MANYYNVTGWKHTGFNTLNRPANRSVLNTAYFTQAGNFITVDGLVVKRDTFEEIDYIDIQGSVKDVKGTQINGAGSTGTHGPGGPFYGLEEIDYIRLTRTGYPGDADYIDINSNMLQPWALNCRSAYYFVTGMKPLGRNVTRVFLLLDKWLSSGGSDELEIESGFKIRGPITDAEDAAGYNIASEGIGLIDDLEVKGSGMIGDPDSRVNYQFITSPIELTHYDPNNADIMDGILATITTQGSTDPKEMVFPKVPTVTSQMSVQCSVPKTDGTSGDIDKTFTIVGYGIFDGANARVNYNKTLLFSAGQLEILDSYQIPEQYIDAQGTLQANGSYTNIKNATAVITSPVQKDIGSYPRKADYLYGQEVLFSYSSGQMNNQPFYDLVDDSINVWAVITPGGSPIARFKQIKNHFYEYDQAVQGIPWIKQTVTMSGASGSMWNQINNSFAQQSNARARALNDYNNMNKNIEFGFTEANHAINLAEQGANIAVSGVSTTNLLSGGKESVSAVANIAREGLDTAKDTTMFIREVQARHFTEEALEQERQQNNAALAQANFKAPYTNFVPDLNSATFQNNIFGVYVLNTTAKDRTRLKNYFKRYGYSGQYDELTWNKIFVKQRVNYIQTEGAMFTHPRFPQRTINEINTMFNNGVFLWNEKPNQAAFNNNPDRT